MSDAAEFISCARRDAVGDGDAWAALPGPRSLPLAEEIAALAAQLDAGTHRLLTCIRMFDVSEEWQRQGAQTCAHWLTWRIGLDVATAREKVRVARALGGLPAIDAALAAGRLSYAKVRALTRVATVETDVRLLDIALATTGAQLERICRRFRRVGQELESERSGKAPALDEEMRSVNVRPLPNGMVRLEINVLPDEADSILQAIDKAREQLRAQSIGTVVPDVAPDAGQRLGATPPLSVGGTAPGAISSASAETSTATAVASGNGGVVAPPLPGRADALVFIADTALASRDNGQWGSNRYQVVVHLEQSLLDADGTMAAFLDDGTRVSAETFRRLSCDGGVVAARPGKDGEGTGRRTRVIAPALRRALWLRDGGCRFPACSNRRFVHGHHIEHWANGGPTTKDNLVLLCSHHHRLLHEGGFAVNRTAAGDLRFLDTRGRVIANVPPAQTVGSAQDRSMTVSLDRDFSLAKDPGLNACGWDGEPVDYDAVLDDLIAHAGSTHARSAHPANA